MFEKHYEYINTFLRTTTAGSSERHQRSTARHFYTERRFGFWTCVVMRSCSRLRPVRSPLLSRQPPRGLSVVYRDYFFHVGQAAAPAVHAAFPNLSQDILLFYLFVLRTGSCDSRPHKYEINNN